MSTEPKTPRMKSQVEKSNGLLGGVKVLDVGEGVSGPYTARTLAWLGADVVKVESPEGDLSRRMGPFPGNAFRTLRSRRCFWRSTRGSAGLRWTWNRRMDRARFLALAAESQIVVDNHPSGWLDERGIGYEELTAVREDIILCQVTPFGDWGPYAKYDAGDLSLFHMSANAHGMLGPVEDPNSEPAIRAGGYQAEQVAGMAAATSTLTALFTARMSGRGCHIVVSSFEAMATQAIAGLSNIAFGRGLSDPRPGRGEGGVHRRAGVGDWGCAAVQRRVRRHISARGRAVGALAGIDGQPRSGRMIRSSTRGTRDRRTRASCGNCCRSGRASDLNRT